MKSDQEILRLICYLGRIGLRAHVLKKSTLLIGQTCPWLSPLRPNMHFITFIAENYFKLNAKFLHIASFFQRALRLTQNVL